MAVLERVATLVRANLNDLIDRAEDPEKMIKQVILDMENQLLQVKTQVAISMADQHLLQKKQKEHEDNAAEWMRKAELAVDKRQDDLARAALERYQSFTKLADELHPAGRGSAAAGRQRCARRSSSSIRSSPRRAPRATCCSRSTAAPARSSKASDAQLAIAGRAPAAGFERMEQKVQRSEAVSQAKSALVADDVERRFESAGKGRRDRPAAGRDKSAPRREVIAARMGEIRAPAPGRADRCGRRAIGAGPAR